MKNCLIFYISVVNVLLTNNLSFSQYSIKQIDKNQFDNEIHKRKVDKKEIDRRGLTFGLNMGVFKGSSEQATYYNGNDRNENSIKYFLNNTYFYNEIKQKLNHRDFTLYSVPSSMSYDMSMMVGFYARYKYNNTTGFFVQFNFSKLNTQNQFAFRIDSVNFTSEPSLRYFPVYGQEERTYIDFGLYKDFYFGEKTNFWVEGGLSFNNTLVKKNGIIVGDLDLSIINVYGSKYYVPNTGMQPYDIRQGGIGFGFFGGAGLNLNFNENISVDPGFHLYYHNSALMYYEGFGLNYSIFVRIIMRNFL